MERAPQRAGGPAEFSEIPLEIKISYLWRIEKTLSGLLHGETGSLKSRALWRKGQERLV